MPALTFRRWYPVAVLLGLCLSGCGGGGGSGQVTQTVPPAKASVQVEKTFSETADPEIKQDAQIASAALKNNDLEVAFVTLRKLQASPKLTGEQDLAVRSALIGVQAQLAQAVVNGDPQALEIARRLQRTP